MTPETTLPSGGETLATILPRLARRSHRLLKQGESVNRDEVHCLLNEIARQRRQISNRPADDLRRWLDRLEDQLAALIGPADEPSTLLDHSATPCDGLSVA